MEEDINLLTFQLQGIEQEQKLIMSGMDVSRQWADTGRLHKM